MTKPSKTKAIERLQKALDAILELKNLSSGYSLLEGSWYDSPEFKEWRRNTQIAIKKTFGNESDQVREFNNTGSSPIRLSTRRMPVTAIVEQIKNKYLNYLASQAAVLKSMINEIEEYWPEENQTAATSEVRKNGQISTNEIFIVHGRDEGAKNAVARFIERLDLVPVILSEIPGDGRTIIEKFEEHAQVGFAVVLLTPDDVGALQDGKNNRKPQARQNVIFELGFFIGRLDRRRVRALVRGEVEIPSDYAGIEYIPLDDSDGWKLRLIQELKSVGFKVDANRAVQT